MKGVLKTMKRAPHLLSSKVGMANKSADAEYDAYRSKVKVLEDSITALLKDSNTFRTAVQTLLASGSNFSKSFERLFQPIGTNEFGLSQKYPAAVTTLENIPDYQVSVDTLRETLSPELDLIDSRIIGPAKELEAIIKRIQKTMVKRDHKLVDFDRHQNSLTKLRAKTNKDLKDEKNLFAIKYEQNFEVATAEYERLNEMLKTQLPQFMEMCIRFMTPLFQSFYYMQLNVYDLVQENMQAFAAKCRYDLTLDANTVFQEKQNDAHERLSALMIGKRGAFSSHTRAINRSVSGGSAVTRSPEPAKTVGGDQRVTSVNVGSLPPPAYSASAGGGMTASSSGTLKRAPPPPPPKPRSVAAAPIPVYVTALYDFEAQAAGDLNFKAGDVIEIVKRTENAEEWWTGKLRGVEGVFPGSASELTASPVCADEIAKIMSKYDNEFEQLILSLSPGIYFACQVLALPDIARFCVLD